MHCAVHCSVQMGEVGLDLAEDLLAFLGGF